MLRVIEDTVKNHWCIMGGRCSPRIYAIREREPEHRSCQSNLDEALMEFGLNGEDIGDVFNVFMNVEISQDGCFVIKPPTAEKGDYIEMRAEMDCIVAVSACPSDKTATNDYKPKSLRVQIKNLG